MAINGCWSFPFSIGMQTAQKKIDPKKCKQDNQETDNGHNRSFLAPPPDGKIADEGGPGKKAR